MQASGRCMTFPGFTCCVLGPVLSLSIYLLRVGFSVVSVTYLLRGGFSVVSVNLPVACWVKCCRCQFTCCVVGPVLSLPMFVLRVGFSVVPANVRVQCSCCVLGPVLSLLMYVLRVGSSVVSANIRVACWVQCCLC